jgi:hypothetical protein
MRLSSDKVKIRPEEWVLKGTFRGHPVEIDMTSFEKEFRGILSKLNRQSDQTVQAVNSNEGSTIIVEGTTTAVLPTAALGVMGKIYHLHDPTLATTDTGWVCRWNTGLAVFEWFQVY